MKDAVARAAREYIEAVDLRKDAEESPEAEPLRKKEQDAHEAYKEARTLLETHGREHGCLQ